MQSRGNNDMAFHDAVQIGRKVLLELKTKDKFPECISD